MTRCFLLFIMQNLFVILFIVDNNTIELSSSSSLDEMENYSTEANGMY